MAKIKRKINKAKQKSNQCRNNGQCPYCRRSRLHNSRLREHEAQMQLKPRSIGWSLLVAAEIAWTQVANS